MKVSPYILLALTSLFWSLNFIIGKIISYLIPPTTINLLRWLLPFLLFLPFSWQEIKRNQHIFKAKWPLFLLLGATGYCLNSICVYEAVRFTTVINTSFINAFNPVLIAVMGYIFYHERISKMQLAGLTLSLMGVLCIIFQGDLKRILGLKINIGDLFMIGSVTFWSIHTVIYKKRAALYPEKSMFTLMMLGGLLFTIPLTFLENLASDWSWLHQVRTVHVLGILSLNIFPSLLAYQFWNSALKKVSANEAAIFLYLIPVYTTAISVIFLNESLRLYHILGGTLIFSGVMLVNYRSLSVKSTETAASFTK